MSIILGFILWCCLLVLCWPLALLVVLLFPIVWLTVLPFRILGLVVAAMLALLHAVFLLPARILGHWTQPANFSAP